LIHPSSLTCAAFATASSEDAVLELLLSEEELTLQPLTSVAPTRALTATILRIG
jgi:hypothetical protein